jgi:hypothetical protein
LRGSGRKCYGMLNVLPYIVPVKREPLHIVVESVIEIATGPPLRPG